MKDLPILPQVLPTVCRAGLLASSWLACLTSGGIDLKFLVNNSGLTPNSREEKREKELKGKLLQLRQVYLESRGKTKNLRFIIENSLTAFISIFQALLYLKEKDVPAERRKIISLISQEMSVDEQIFLNLLKIKEGTLKLSAEALNTIFEDYIKEIRKLSYTVDQLTL